MSNKFTRREFLGTTLAASLAVGAIPAISGRFSPERASAGLNPRLRESLRAAMDEIIPAGDGMPAASQAGGLEYLERVSRQEPQIGADLEQALHALERLTESRFHAGVASVTSSQRVEILTALETQSSEVFAKLRDHVYEAYYTQPKIWQIIGYDFYPTNESGPHMKPFDESVLSNVRKMPRLYREVR